MAGACPAPPRRSREKDHAMTNDSHPMFPPLNRRSFLIAAAATGLAAGARAAEPARKFRVAVIGHTGRGDYGHGIDTMWLNIPETEIVAVADPDTAGLAAAQKKLQVAQGFADYRQMLSAVKPDIVAVGMRHVDQHRDVALAAAESGAGASTWKSPSAARPPKQTKSFRPANVPM